MAEIFFKELLANVVVTGSAMFFFKKWINGMVKTTEVNSENIDKLILEIKELEDKKRSKVVCVDKMAACQGKIGSQLINVAVDTMDNKDRIETVDRRVDGLAREIRETISYEFEKVKEVLKR